MELELRAKVSNLELIKKKLNEIKAIYIRKVIQIDEYYGSIELYKKLGYSFVVRVRKSNDSYFLTIKSAEQKIDGYWTEYESQIQDPKVFSDMFLSMGFEKIINLKKIREEYKLADKKILLDEFENYGNFIEIEKITHDSDKTSIIKLFERLDIGKKT